jgi:UDP-N-acetylmuramoyl-L-alanyl-D-glutamate--2,6-diaminopimelate ligase
MTLSEVLAGVPLRSELPPSLARADPGLDYDSRRVQPGFFSSRFRARAWTGASLPRRPRKRARSRSSASCPRPKGWTAPWIQVEHGRQALALASKTFYGKLDEKLPLTGITGTNGKTTTSYLVDSILRAAGKTTMLAGTIEYRMGSKILPAPNTTPESLDLHRMLAELDAMGGTPRDNGSFVARAGAGPRLRAAFSHGGVHQSDADHLDFHGTMEDYFAAKQLLFTGDRAGRRRAMRDQSRRRMGPQAG